MVRKVLFVCTGNTCRSVMAEYLLKNMLEENRLSDISVSSAGVAASPQYKIFGVLKNVMDGENLDVSSHMSTQVTAEIINAADLILVMEQQHKDFIERIVENSGGKTHLLKAYAGIKEDLDIADPIGQPEDVYRATMNEIKGYLEKALSLIKGV